MTLLAASAFIALAVMLMPAPRAFAQTPTSATGKLEGQLINGTKDAKLANASSITVTLLSAAANATSVMSQTAKSDADGKFTFANLDATPSTRYLLTAQYFGVDYASDVLTFAPSQTTMTATLTVNETTNDPTVITVMQNHLVIEVQANLMNVIQIVQVVNMSDRAFVGAGSNVHRPTLLLPILSGAQDIQFENPEADASTLRGPEVMTYTMPFVPGMDQIVFNYIVPFKPPTYQFSLKIPVDIGKVRVLLSDVNAKIASTQLITPTIFPTQNGQTFLQTTADNVKAGTSVDATFSNLTGSPGSASTMPPTGASPATSTIPGVGDNVLIGGVIIGVAAIAAIGLLVYPLMKRRAAQAVVSTEAEQRLELLQELADLDDEFEAGKIAEDEYKKEREAIKADLRELMQGSGSAKSAADEE